jgi:peptidoglycan/LPS O-acetylase OafA/YrhL
VRRRLDAATALVSLLLAGILASWILVDGVGPDLLFTGGILLHAAACALLIGLCAELSQAVGATAPASNLLPLRVLEAGPVRWLGRVSYSLYLWHWPVVALLPVLLGADHARTTMTAAAIGIALVLAAASTHLVEDPIRFRARWARGRTGAVLFAIAWTALLLLWLALPPPAAPHIDPDSL